MTKAKVESTFSFAFAKVEEQGAEMFQSRTMWIREFLYRGKCQCLNIYLLLKMKQACALKLWFC